MSIERYFKGKEIQLIMGVFQDKEYEKITSILCPLAKKVYTVELPNKARTLSAGKLADCARNIAKKQKRKTVFSQRWTQRQHCAVPE